MNRWMGGCSLWRQLVSYFLTELQYEKTHCNIELQHCNVELHYCNIEVQRTMAFEKKWHWWYMHCGDVIQSVLQCGSEIIRWTKNTNLPVKEMCGCVARINGMCDEAVKCWVKKHVPWKKKHKVKQSKTRHMHLYMRTARNTHASQGGTVLNK